MKRQYLYRIILDSYRTTNIHVILTGEYRQGTQHEAKRGYL